jgi:hypothetical protein
VRASNKNAAEKRKKEVDRQKWQAQKAERRLQRQHEKQARAAMGDEEDPDLAGIVPGPQPQPVDEALLGVPPADAPEPPADSAPKPEK